MHAKSSTLGLSAAARSKYRDRQAAKALEELRLLPVIAAAKPLAIGIDKLIAEAYPELDPERVRAFLAAHVSSIAYLKNVAQGRARFNLQCEPRGMISLAHRAYAVKRLGALEAKPR